jgi:hypothetical protein
MAFSWTGFWAAGLEGTVDRMNYCLLGVGLKSEFPVASTDFQGSLAWASDEEKLYYCTGTAWTAIAPGLNIAETIGGVKTFSSIPVLPASDPTADNEAVRKAYVDNSFFAKFREFIPWTSLDGFTVGGDAGYSVLPKGAYVALSTGTTSDYDAKLYTQDFWYGLLDTGKITTFEFPLMYLYTTSLQNIWLRLASVAVDPPYELTDHIGWKINGADLYASNADGAAQTITDTTIDVVQGYQRTRLKVVLNPGTDCKFYVNDVLKVTHTTNLPDALNLLLHFHVRTLEAASKYIYIGRVLIEKEHA